MCSVRVDADHVSVTPAAGEQPEMSMLLLASTSVCIYVLVCESLPRTGTVCTMAEHEFTASSKNPI